jgi:hypothetical protein
VKVMLAPRYRFWMLVLLPGTLGLGSAVLWIRSLSWPLHFDDDGLTLRNHRRMDWGAIRKIGVSRRYLDGRVSEIRIYSRDGVSKIPARALQNGEIVVRAILAMFEQTARDGVNRVRLRSDQTSLGDAKKMTQVFRDAA